MNTRTDRTPELERRLADQISDRLRPEWRQHLPLMTTTASKSILNCQQANYRPLTAARKKRPPLDRRAKRKTTTLALSRRYSNGHTEMCL